MPGPGRSLRGVLTESISCAYKYNFIKISCGDNINYFKNLLYDHNIRLTKYNINSTPCKKKIQLPLAVTQLVTSQRNSDVRSKGPAEVRDIEEFELCSGRPPREREGKTFTSVRAIKQMFITVLTDLQGKS